MIEPARMNEQRDFGEVWAELSKRLARVLSSRRVPNDCVDDLVQETGLRLFKRWDRVDQTTAWALALTIAGNLIRDDMRKSVLKEREETTVVPIVRDIDDQLMARIELRRVEKALESLSHRDRALLLTEWGVAEPRGFVSTAAMKTARMRARKRLRAVLERASAFLPTTLRWNRPTWLQSPVLAAFPDQLLQIAAGALLVISGAGIVQIADPDRPDVAAAVAAVAMAQAPPGGRSIDLPPQTTSARSASTLGAAGSRTDTTSGERMNENFGPVQVTPGGGRVGHGSGLGPYGADQTVDGHPSGAPARAHARARYEAPRCEGEMSFPTGWTYHCDGAGHAEAEGEGEAAGHEQGAEVDPEP